MVKVNEANPSKLIEQTASELKKIKEFEPPTWAMFVKTGTSKARPPMKQDWWHTRVASILLKVHKMGPIGVNKLRTLYGGRKDRGVKPEEFRKASGNIIRKAMQQLEKADFIKKTEKGVHKGKILTSKGLKLLNSAAKQIKNE